MNTATGVNRSVVSDSLEEKSHWPQDAPTVRCPYTITDLPPDTGAGKRLFCFFNTNRIGEGDDQAEKYTYLSTGQQQRSGQGVQ